MKTESGELRICGLAAVRARFQRDAGSILRLYFDHETGRKIGLMCKALAAARRIYRCVEPAELEKIAGTIHHGGIVAVVRPPPLAVIAPGELAVWARRREPVLVLDRIGNAHNLGAIARSAAFFRVPHLVIPADPGAARPGDAAYRVAEGGLEKVEVRVVPRLPAFLRDLAAAGYEVMGAAGKAIGRIQPQRLDAAAPAATSPPRAIVLGNEEDGLAPDTAAACSRLIAISGDGGVDSLNVSVAAAVLLWELLERGRDRADRRRTK